MELKSKQPRQQITGKDNIYKSKPTKTKTKKLYKA